MHRIVRYAPSPTGKMHIANLRTAIYNYLYVKEQILVRIEDTDFERSTKEYEDGIFEVLKVFDIPYKLSFRQSERLEIYRQIGKTLYDNGYAFYCQCDSTQCKCDTQNLSQGVLRFKVPSNQELSFDDQIYGVCTRNTNDIENFAIIRSDGTATYMLAVVVDDHASEITHVIRGEDHRTNTFKQILIYNAMNWEIPKFAHLPMILGTDGKKLSKRNGDTSVEYFLSQGYVPNALFNMMIRTGWSHGDDEVISRSQALEYFDIKNVNKHAATFDTKKLNYLNQYYMKKEDYSHEISRLAGMETLPLVQQHYFEIVSRCHTLVECANLIRPIFECHSFDTSQFDTDSLQQVIQLNTNSNFEEWMDQINQLPNPKKIREIIRLITTGAKSGLPLHIIYEYKIHGKKIINT